MYTLKHYQESALYLKDKLGKFTPEVLLILGSGLGFLAEEVENPIFVKYGDIPHFRSSSAPGHAGRFVAGVFEGKNVLAMQGRLHLYEGYSPEESAYPVRVANLVGADKLLLTCACGGVNTDYKVGDLVLMTDYINFTHPSLLAGYAGSAFDLTGFENRFFDMSKAFDTDYRKLAHDVANTQKIPLHEGVYFYTTGPQYETPAEIRAIRTLGGDLVGMSAVHETLMARRCNMRVTGFGLVTNMAAGVLDQPLSEEEVLTEAKNAAPRFSALVRGVVKGL
ncbi:MAG: purine-nucleoside phosphorylase [Defluviitaleaceae bacterium]|nr:purine-nucleoside phosphorylase [Defluviitaleaceae bacterium]MCL2274336.1 purine-nucleoside phosphorylase [Defluviitaleaceae bacterium]